MRGHPSLIPRAWILLTIPIAITMAISSAGGAFGHAYARETASWAAQGMAQDRVNLAFVLPLLLVVAAAARRGSFRAWLVWLGVMLYLVYSFVLYAFCVHFNAWFLAYVATLGMTFYAVVGSVLTLDLSRVRDAFRRQAPTRPAAIFLVIVGVAFTLLWMTDIVSAMRAGRAPATVEEVGLPVNPVHVLDLAFALPGVIVTGFLVGRRHVYGLLFTVPCSVFLIVMGVAIVAMGGPIVPLATTIVIATYVTWTFLRECTNDGGHDFDHAD